MNVSLDDKLTIPDKSATYRSIEGLIQHFELFMWNRRFETPVEEVYGANETANGELGFYLVADGGGKAFRARTRPPSFIHFAAFPHLIEGHQISDVPAVLGSLNIIAAERIGRLILLARRASEGRTVLDCMRTQRLCTLAGASG